MALPRFFCCPKAGLLQTKGDIMRSKVKVIILLFIALSMGVVFGCGISDGPSPEAATDPVAANKLAGISSQNSEGLALYASKCAGCHGNIDVTNIVVPTSFSDIRSAISSNIGGMRVYAAMSDVEVQAIAEAINDPTCRPYQHLYNLEQHHRHHAMAPPFMPLGVRPVTGTLLHQTKSVQA